MTGDRLVTGYRAELCDFPPSPPVSGSAVIPRSSGDDWERAGGTTPSRFADSGWVRVGPHTLGRSQEPDDALPPAPAGVDRRRLALTFALALPLIVAILAAALT